MTGAHEQDDELLTATEVAELFGVTPRTVTRWANEGKLTALRTEGGHRRYRPSEVHELHDQITGNDSQDTDDR